MKAFFLKSAQDKFGMTNAVCLIMRYQALIVLLAHNLHTVVIRKPSVKSVTSSVVRTSLIRTFAFSITNTWA